MKSTKLIRLLERAAHPGTPDHERANCARQALKIVQQREKLHFLGGVAKPRLWRFEANGGAVCWFDACRVLITPVDHFGARVFQLRIGDNTLEEFFPTLEQAKLRAEKDMG